MKKVIILAFILTSCSNTYANNPPMTAQQQQQQTQAGLALMNYGNMLQQQQAINRLSQPPAPRYTNCTNTPMGMNCTTY